MRLLDLPDLVLERIVSNLTDREVAQLQVVCKSLQSITRSTSIWRSLLQTYHNLRVEADPGCSNADEQALAFQKLYATFDGLEEDPIQVVGVFTDGGVDEDYPRLWMNNMFQRALYNYYCSDVGRNINCIGLITDAQLTSRGEAATDRLIRDYSIERITAHWLIQPEREWENPQWNWEDVDPEDPGLRDFARSELQEWDTQELAAYLMALFQAHRRGNPDGFLLFYGLEEPALSREIRMCEHVLSLAAHPERYSVNEKTRKLRGSRCWIGEGALESVTDNIHSFASLAGQISAICVNRKGVFSCPVSTLVVYAVYLPYSHPKFGSELRQDDKVFQEIANSTASKLMEDCSSLSQLQEACKKGVDGTKLDLVEGEITGAGRWIEFAPQKFRVNSQGVAIEPVLWMKYFSKREAQAYEETIELDLSQELDSMDIAKSMHSEEMQEDRSQEGPSLPEFFKLIQKRERVVMERVESNDAQELRQDEEYGVTTEAENWRLTQVCLLRYPRVANAVMVKLIDAEDLMEEMGDGHDQPNIDITSVTFDGKALIMPHHITLQP